MKHSAIFILIAALALLNGCQKQSDLNYNQAADNPSPSPVIVRMHAGTDTTITFPVNEITLKGSYTITGAAVIPLSITWTKISGPAHGYIVDTGSLETQVKNLVPGVYMFELKGNGPNFTATSSVVRITVKQDNTPIGTNEFIFQNLTWLPRWYNTLDIDDFYNRVPGLTRGIPYNVYIRRPPSTSWLPVENAHNYTSSSIYVHDFQDHSQFGYSGGTLFVHYFGNDISDRPDIKIVY